MIGIGFRIAGDTVGITVSTVASGTISVNANCNDVVNYAAFLNSGPTLAAVTLGGAGGNVPAPVFPVTTAGTENTFIIGANNQLPVLIAVPNAPFSFRAITNSTVPTQLYVTPVIST